MSDRREEDHAELMLLIKKGAEVIENNKRRQWTALYYVFLLYALVIGFVLASPNPELVYRIVLTVFVGIVFIFSKVFLLQIRQSILSTRSDLTRIREELPMLKEYDRGGGDPRYIWLTFAFIFLSLWGAALSILVLWYKGS
jgi:hypothetical protein